MKNLISTTHKNNPTIGTLVYSADAVNWKDTQKKALDLYRQGKLFNIVLRGVGSVGDFEISKNRVYSNDAIAEAFTVYNDLIKEFPYYRHMFDSHPSSESDERPEMGEGNTYDSIGAYVLKVKLVDKNLNGNLHKVINFDYVITKQSILDYFMRSIDPIIAISHRGFMGKVSKYPRETIKLKYDNITFLSDAFNNLEFQDKNSDTVDYVEYLRLLGFDLVTYPADFLCQSRKQDIIAFNVTDNDSLKDTNNISHDFMYQYVKDRCANIHSPLGMLRMKVDQKYMINSLKSQAVLDEVKFILKTNGEAKMKIELDKLTDKQYMFGVFDDLNEMFKLEVSDIWTKDSDKIGDWLDEALKDEIKASMENKDEFVSSLKVLFDNQDQFAELFSDWHAQKVLDFNADIIRVMIEAIGQEKFSTIMENEFNVTSDTVAGILDEYKTSKPELYESLNTNLVTMASDFDYYKKIADKVLVVDNSTETTPTEEPTAEVTDAQTTSEPEDTTPVKDEQSEAAPNDENNDTPPEVVLDGLIFVPELNNDPWDEGIVKSTCSTIMSSEKLSESDTKKLIDDVYAINRGYDAQKGWKMPHHSVVVDGDKVTVTVNKAGLDAATHALLGSRLTVIASSEEKRQAAEHLKGHYTELGIEPPENLVKIAENAKFADLVVEADLVFSLDEAFIAKIIDEQTKIKSDAIDTESEVINVLDALYTVMRPFIKQGARIDLNEDLFRKLAQSINGAAIGLAAVMNGEGSDIMNLDDNAIISTMRNQILELRDELTQTKDNAVMVTKERDDLREKVSDYEAKVDTIGQLSDDVNKATQLVEDLNNLNHKKLQFVFTHRSSIDDDIFREVIGVKSVDQLATIGKWLNKIGTKKVIMNSMFGDKVPTETENTPPESTEASMNNDLILIPTQDRKKNESLEGDDNVKTILNLIRG